MFMIQSSALEFRISLFEDGWRKFDSVKLSDEKIMAHNCF